jgi:succinoglycan biosynthesis transport protein ExoP
MELRQYLQIAWRWAWLLVLGLSIGAFAGYFYSARQTRVYQSSAKVMVSQPPNSATTYYNTTYDQQLAQNYIQLLTTQPLLTAVSEKLGYSVSDGQISTELIENTSLFWVFVEDTNPQRAADIGNTLVNELILQNEQLQNTRYSSEEQSLQAQIAQVKDQISSLQNQIASISAESLTSQQDRVKAEINGLEAQILQVNNEINVLQSNNQNGETPAPTFTPEEQSQLQEKQLKLEQLQSSLDFYNSIYLNLSASEISGVTGSTSSDQATQLQSALALYQQIYSNYLSSSETIQLAKLQNTPNIVQVEMAVPISNPIRPKPMNMMALGGAVGLMLAAVIVFVIEYLDDTIKSPIDITDRFDLPVIGYIGEMSKSTTGDGKVYVSTEPLSSISEAFRSLRTNIEYSDVENPPKTFLITSPNSTEGKTTIAVNLAMTFAQSGKDTVIVDADFRRPMVHHYFSLPNRRGLSDVIQGTIDIKAAVRSRNDSRLAVIPSGSLPPNPYELLASDNMIRFIEQLKQVKLVSIIDSPPFLVADAAQIAAKVDRVILVVQPGKTSTHTLEASLEQLNRVGANVLGVVFNRIPHNRGYYYGNYKNYSQYYSKDYQSSYSRSHGNGSKPIREKTKKVITTYEDLGFIKPTGKSIYPRVKKE